MTTKIAAGNPSAPPISLKTRPRAQTGGPKPPANCRTSENRAAGPPPKPASRPLDRGSRRMVTLTWRGRADFVALLDHRPHLGSRRRLAVKIDQHVRAPSRRSLKTDLAMKRADHRGEM